MDDLQRGAILWLVVLGALAVVLGITLRRMSALAARTRSLERFQAGVTGIDIRLAAIADPFVLQLDEIRRRSGDPQAITDALPGAHEALATLADEGRALKVPPALAGHAAAIVTELDRAVRAVDMVEHGLDALLAHRGGRELEGQTSLKRGALNLRHAREAMNRIARDVAAVRPADLVAGPPRSSRAGAGPQVPTYLVDADLDGEGS